MMIRLAQRKDAAAITEQNIALAKESENILLSHEVTFAGVKAVLSDTTKGFYLVAEEHNRIVGQLMVTVEWSDWRNKPLWWIQSVYVQKEWRNKHVFRSLLDDVRQRAQQQRVAFLRLYVHQDNKSARRVYEKTGWRPDPYVMYQLPV
ncbi:MAG: GNAT family N-acetyltransferase [Candidatus Thermoplasmatota archaeon]